MDYLVNQPWKGNVRELENALIRAVILAKGDVILKEYLPLEPAQPARAEDQSPFTRELLPLWEIEKRYIQYVLEATRGSKSRASQILDISRPTLDKKIKDYDLRIDTSD